MVTASGCYLIKYSFGTHHSRNGPKENILSQKGTDFLPFTRQLLCIKNLKQMHPY